MSEVGGPDQRQLEPRSVLVARDCHVESGGLTVPTSTLRLSVTDGSRASTLLLNVCFEKRFDDPVESLEHSALVAVPFGVVMVHVRIRNHWRTASANAKVPQP